MVSEELLNLKSHSVDLNKESAGRGPIIVGIGLGPAQRGNLLLKQADAIETDLHFLLVGDHDGRGTKIRVHRIRKVPVMRDELYRVSGAQVKSS